MQCLPNGIPLARQTSGTVPDNVRLSFQQSKKARAKAEQCPCLQGATQALICNNSHLCRLITILSLAMSRFNFIFFLAIVSVLILTRLFDVQISATQGLSIKNIVLYMSLIVVLIEQMGGLSVLTRMPAVVPLASLFFLATLSLAYAPLFAGGVILDTRDMLSLYKNEVFDPVVYFVIGFMLITKSMSEPKPLLWLVVIFGILNIVALSVFVTGVNPFEISVISHEGTRFASYGGLANQGAYALLFFFPLNYYFFEKAESRLIKILLLTLILTGFLGVFLTGSKGGYLLTIVLCLTLMFRTKRYSFFISLMATGIVGVIAYAALFGSDSPLETLGRMSLLFDSGDEAERLARQGITGVDAISSGRTIVWRSIAEVLANDPMAMLIGKGWGTYHAHMLRTAAGGAAAHNVFLKMLLELGLVGLSLLLIVGWKLMKYLKASLVNRNRLFYQCISASFIAVFWMFMLSAPINLYGIMAFTFGLIISYSVHLSVPDDTESKNSIRGRIHKKHGLMSGSQ